MALKNPKKRKSVSSYSKSSNPKKKSLCTPPLKVARNAEDTQGCSLLTKLIDSGVVADHEPVFYMRKRDRSVMKEGILTRQGVLCTCCRQIFLLSRFEVHAGSGLHRPSANMFLKDGRSLMQCQKTIVFGGAHIKTFKCSRIDHSSYIKSNAVPSNLLTGNKKNDSMCQMCGDCGQLILCDTCPSAFHPDCLGLDVVPDGEWHCPRCRCGACRGSILDSGVQTSDSNVNMPVYVKFSPTDHSDAAASPSYTGAFSEDNDAGKILASPNLEETEVSTAKEFPVFYCAHCQVPYHFNCVKGGQQHQCDGPWFCSKSCKHTFDQLHSRVGRASPLYRGLSWMLIRSNKGDIPGIEPSSVHQIFETRLSEAYRVLQECFDPVIDTETGVDLLLQTLFNKKAELRRLDCSRFYAMILLKGDDIVSVATFRVHGQQLAEMPFIATKFEFRQQGMCRALMKALESMLIDIGVHKLVLPSVDELCQTWLDSFGFRVLTLQERQQLSHVGILPFVGTKLLHKSLMRSEAVRDQATVPETVENKTKPGFLRVKLRLGAASMQATNFEPISCH